jgi:hypothetical protein
VVDEQLPAVGEEPWIGRIHDQVFRLIAAHDIFVEIEGFPVPVGILE